MLDVLVAIKWDLTINPAFGTNGANALQQRIDRACAAIDAAIRDLMPAAVGLSHADGEDKLAGLIERLEAAKRGAAA